MSELVWRLARWRLLPEATAGAWPVVWPERRKTRHFVGIGKAPPPRGGGGGAFGRGEGFQAVSGESTSTSLWSMGRLRAGLTLALIRPLCSVWLIAEWSL